jgi:hypothetical protein
MTTHAYILWILTAAYALHYLEEYCLDWKDWANRQLHLPVTWSHFLAANSVVVVFGIAVGMVGWQCPEFSLIFPALMLINAVFFHIVPTVVQRVFSPGLITAVLLFLPLALWTYYGAWQDGVLTFQVFVISSLGGALLMASPVVFIKWQQRRTSMH